MLFENSISNFCLPSECSCNARFISVFAVVPRLFTQSSDFRISQTHIVVRVTLPPFLVHLSGHLELNIPLPIAITAFRLITSPLAWSIWRMAFISVTNSSLTIEGCPFWGTVKNSTPSWHSKFFWFFIF